ncbi:MAG: VOC family protein [Planctomycetota bacterium]
MINGINHLTLAVKSIDSAFRFYRDILQLKPVMKSAISAYFLAGDTWIALAFDERFVPSTNYTHIAFAVPSADYPSTVARLRALQVVEWQTNKTEGDSLYLLDDSGNRLEIHASNLAARIDEGKAHWGRDVEWFV